jgi:hypothetical protein
MCSGDHSEEAQAAINVHNEKVSEARKAVDRIRDRVAERKGSDIAWATVTTNDLQALLDMILWYEQGISWATECTHCAGLWEENCDQWHHIQELQKRLQPVATSTDRVDSPIVNPDPQPSSGLWCYECADTSPHLKSRHRGW